MTLNNSSGRLVDKAEVAVLVFKTAAHDLRPFGEVVAGDVVPANPRQPFNDLRLVAPGHFTDFFKRGFDIDSDVASVGARHVAVIKIDNDGDFAGSGPGFIGWIFRREGMGTLIM